VVYQLTPQEDNYISEGENPKQLVVSEAAYFSMVTFTTLGYGDFIPHGYFRAISVTESFLGYIYLGLFVSGIVNLINYYNRE
jgi:hypothetical protein